MQRLLKILGSIVAAVILGAIGSGVWEKALSPGLSYLSNATTSMLGQLSSSYEDSIYQRAARDTTDLYPMKLSMLILFILGAAMVVGITLRALKQVPLHERHQRRIAFLFSIQGFTFGLALAVFTYINLARLDVASQIKADSLRSLEILRPAVGDASYYRLRADYYAIESRRDYEQFSVAVLERAKSASIRVPLGQTSR